MGTRSDCQPGIVSGPDRGWPRRHGFVDMTPVLAGELPHHSSLALRPVIRQATPRARPWPFAARAITRARRRCGRGDARGSSKVESELLRKHGCLS